MLAAGRGLIGVAATVLLLPDTDCVGLVDSVEQAAVAPTNTANSAPAAVADLIPIDAVMACVLSPAWSWGEQGSGAGLGACPG